MIAPLSMVFGLLSIQNSDWNRFLFKLDKCGCNMTPFSEIYKELLHGHGPEMFRSFSNSSNESCKIGKMTVPKWGFRGSSIVTLSDFQLDSLEGPLLQTLGDATS
ncbi:hypothetical protein NPIL_9531 [Nephila pilipes]|uniref:Uncharacterized protein n=1 Tax=Nephila pilipes TaxID=299642 RepID=A0A8X6P3F0_NEPPI|nr:hypothetical protein NPIL_9531 [Nephila pilipes]